MVTGPFLAPKRHFRTETSTFGLGKKDVVALVSAKYQSVELPPVQIYTT